MINLRQDGGRTLVLPRVTLFPSLGGLTVSEEWMEMEWKKEQGAGGLKGGGAVVGMQNKIVLKIH